MPIQNETPIGVNSGSVIPFPIVGNPNPYASGSNISVSSLGIICIASTGWYQMTWGFITANGPGIFEVQIGGSANTVPLGVNYARIDFSSGSGNLQSQTALINATSNPTYVSIVNTGGSTIYLQSGSQNTTNPGGFVAYITIIKIGN